jgi:hypothetical protein
MSQADLLKSFQQYSRGDRFPLLVNQNFIHDEFTNEYDQQTTTYRLSIPLPSQEQSQLNSILSSYELLAFLSSNFLSFASKFQDSFNEILDFPSHLLPSLETSLITFPSENENENNNNLKKKKKSTLYFRLPLPNSSPTSSVAFTLHQHLSSGKWISEKLLFRWTIQILRTLKLAHERFLTFPSFNSQHIHLLSDEMILAAYRLQFHSIRQRNKKQEEGLKNLRIQSRVGFGVNSSSSFNSSSHENMKLPDISSKKLQFKPPLSNAKPPAPTMPAISTSNSVFSTSSSTLTSQTQVTRQCLVPAVDKLAPRKDAWLLLPFDSLTPVEDPREMEMSVSSEPLGIQGDQDDESVKEVLPKLSKSQSFRRQSSTESTRSISVPTDQDQDQLNCQQQTTLSAWLRRYQINPREKEITEESMYQVSFRSLSFLVLSL